MVLTHQGMIQQFNNKKNIISWIFTDHATPTPKLAWTRKTIMLKIPLPDNEFECLASGSNFQVYKVRNRIDQSIYAIKKIFVTMDGKKQTQSQVHHIIREVRYLAQLSHPNIIRYYNSWIESDDSLAQILESPLMTFGDHLLFDRSEEASERVSFSDEDDETKNRRRLDHLSRSSKNTANGTKYLTVYIQTEYCEQSLENYIFKRNQEYARDRNDFKLYKESLEISKCLLKGLNYIHSQFKLVHYNLKPSNIFINNPDDVKIGDFGFVQKLKELNGYTQPANQFGYVSARILSQDENFYLAPEQTRLMQYKHFDQRGDIFSFGQVMLQLFYPVMDANAATELLSNSKKGVLPALWPEIQEIIEGCTKGDVNKRIGMKDLYEKINQVKSRKTSYDVPPVVLGYMKVQFEDEHDIQQRYFVVSNKILSIYKSENSGKAYVMYDLDDCQIKSGLEAVEVSHNRLASFRLFAENKSELLKCLY